MTPERWQQVKQIFQSAVERPPAERAAFISSACADDAELRSEVESLISSLEQAGKSLQAMAADAATELLANRSTDSIVGKQIGHYKVSSLIGRGGMGEVFLALDTTLGRKVALKLLRGEFTNNEERLRRFQQEARAASALNHPNILTIHEIGQDDSLQFLATEYVEGQTLRQRMASARMPLGQTLDVAIQVASALAAAHQAGIIHRDIKPDNIMVRADGYVKVLDFGLAKLVEATTTDTLAPTLPKVETETGVVMGTVGYMSPEQARGLAVDARTDIWSLGVMTYEMTSGHQPFEAETASDVLASILEKEPPPIAHHFPRVPRELERIVSKALRKQREDRYQTADELLVELKDLKRQLERAAEGGPLAKSSRRVIVTGIAILLIVALGVGIFIRRAQAESERKATVAEMEHLVDTGRFVEAWRIGRAALQRWPADPQLEHPMEVTTQPVTIVTDPPGAEVAFKAYEDVKSDWLPLGTTPLKEVRAPVGQLRWRITKAGFEPLEARIEVGAPAAADGRPDVNAPPLRLRPIGSDVGRMVFVPGGNQSGVALTDYWIDQFEVTNREFKEFIDRGGYQSPQYWTQVPDDKGLTATFHDQTGRPGPSTWELGTYPEGKDDYPVGGVSWFEAAAYCQANGKSLPTVYHWRKAFGASFFIEVLKLGNFNGQGPEPTAQLKEVGPFGTYGMAGNVKEWVWNEFSGRRYILGGAWNEPVYMAVADDAQPPLDRAETHGFRCMKEMTPSQATAYEPYVGSRPTSDVTKEKPVDAATFEVFRRFYSYDRTPLDPKIERIEEGEYWRRERVSFAAAYGGERVLANILIPRNAAPPYQAVIWFPGSYALGLTSSERELVFSYYFDFLPRSGRALVYPVYKGTYERRISGAANPGTNLRRDLVVQWSKDLGRTIDYLETRNDVDHEKLAYYGFSLGAYDALPAVALEPRIKTAILLAGGVVGPVRPPEIEPLNFLPRIKMPVLLLAGRNDFYFPVETSQDPLIKLLGTPPENKRHVVFEGAGHVPPRLEVIREILNWLDRYLGPVGK
jgi:Serine/threonine protein kinase